MAGQKPRHPQARQSPHTHKLGGVKREVVYSRLALRRADSHKKGTNGSIDKPQAAFVTITFQLHNTTKAQTYTAARRLEHTLMMVRSYNAHMPSKPLAPTARG